MKPKYFLFITSLLFSSSLIAQKGKTNVKQTAPAVEKTPDTKLQQSAVKTYPMLHVSDDDIDKLIYNMKYTEAADKLKKNINQAKRRRKDTSVMDAQLERCNRAMQTLRGTDRVVVVDSVIVDKKSFLSAYGLSDELGTVKMINGGQSTEFITQLGNKVYSVETLKESSKLYSCYIENGKRTDKKKVEGLDVDGDINYPFLMPDGSTLYFSARSSDGLGNYDIYVTRYDYDEDRYYKAESLGFPYNSYANDYMMVIDDDKHIGWFASDRFQPEGKVCIYTFIPNNSRHTFDYENTPLNKVIAAARLCPISITWNTENAAQREQAKNVIKSLKESAKSAKKYEFTLVIDDRTTYYSYSDFRSAKARSKCVEWIDKSKKLKDIENTLQYQREQFHRYGNDFVKKQVLSLEKQYEQLLLETEEAEKLTRKFEVTH